MASLILGTAGHIDHGKSALVQALTGTDTDRLKEEKARGITIELGFAELAVEGRTHFGVVDVPGHEAFVRAMVAGAAGMDVVLLIVAADEGVMPQTREHLAIVRLLDVPELVVAVTKCDSVEEEWLELVDAEVEELLADTPYAKAPRVATSAVARTGLDALLAELAAAGDRVDRSEHADLARLPLDRVFTIQGTGTVVTGTLWSGALEVGEKVRVLPEGLEGRIRSIEAHGRGVDRIGPGTRAAVALTGAASDRSTVARGSTLVTDPAWRATWMLTTRIAMLPDTSWTLEHNQRLHVHHGTAEVLARCRLLESHPLGAGDEGWVQLRLEEPILARARDRLVLRAYSPVTTIGGGIIAEPDPPKRNRIDDDERRALQRVVSGEPGEIVIAALGLAGWHGVPRRSLPIVTGLTPDEVEQALADRGTAEALASAERVFGAPTREEAERLVLEAVDRGHETDPLRASVPLAAIRAGLPPWAPPELAGATISSLVDEGRLESADGGVRRPGFSPELTRDQEAASASLLEELDRAGLAPPTVDELPEVLRKRADFWSLVHDLERRDEIRQLSDGLYVSAAELDRAASRIGRELGGRTNLGPADFREVLEVTRKHLIPILNYFDGRGTTLRHEAGRDVPAN